MEEVNVEAIKARLISLGFDTMAEEKLMGQLCFGAPSFDLRFDKVAGEDSCTYLVHLERANEKYSITYYHAFFKKGFSLPTSIGKFEPRMMNINWKQIAHSLSSVGFYVDLTVLHDAFSLLREIKVIPEASLLLYKFWAGTSFESLVPGVGALKARYELMQRFYVSEEHQPITSDEAMRFLQNRWMEKAMQQSRLQQRQGASDTQISGPKKSKRKVGKKK